MDWAINKGLPFRLSGGPSQAGVYAYQRGKNGVYFISSGVYCTFYAGGISNFLLFLSCNGKKTGWPICDGICWTGQFHSTFPKRFLSTDTGQFTDLYLNHSPDKDGFRSFPRNNSEQNYKRQKVAQRHIPSTLGCAHLHQHPGVVVDV